jgi:geranylgeranyl pyrophosphate synthase
MDNDKVRRGNPTIHHKYGETVAQIITMYLLTSTFNLLQENMQTLKEQGIPNYNERLSFVYQCISENLGILGAPMGQFLDLYPCLNQISDLNNTIESKRRDITKVLEKKTATFFEIAFVLGFVCSGGDLSKLEKVKLCARAFGIAFQITDDFEDQEKDMMRHQCPNLVNGIGLDASVISYNTTIGLCKTLLLELELSHPVISELYYILDQRVLKYQNKSGSL